MTVEVLDRLTGTASDTPGEQVALGRYVVRHSGEGMLLQNTFAVSSWVSLVPDASGRWTLSGDGVARAEGSIAKAQIPDALDIRGFTGIGQALDDVIASGGTWLDAIELSPLQPGMSQRADLQPYEGQLEDRLGHLEAVCRRPRTQLDVDVERTAVSRARRVAPGAANHLAAHTEDWERRTLRSVVPRRILAIVREDDYDIYENRVAARLVDHLFAYLGRRIQEVVRLIRVFQEASDYSTSAAGGSYRRQDRLYRLWGESIDASDARRTAERTLHHLELLRQRVGGLKGSVLYREVPRGADIGASLTVTNILRDDLRYRRVADLWRDWAHLGRERTVQPREFYDEMQEVTRTFSRFALLLVLRAMEQLGFEPVELEDRLDLGRLALRVQGQEVQVAWTDDTGVIELSGVEVDPLRIVPMCAAIAEFTPADAWAFVGAADSARSVILYPAPTAAPGGSRFDIDLSRRLYALSHEVTDGHSGRASFIPVSTWDIGSVERVARQLRWSVTNRRFSAYPPVATAVRLGPVVNEYRWLRGDHTQAHIIEPPPARDVDRIRAARTEASHQLDKLEAELESVTNALRETQRAGRPGGDLPARSSALRAQVAAARERDGDLALFLQGIDSAAGFLGSLLQCPTCPTRIDPVKDFRGDTTRFTAKCPDCSTEWRLDSCAECKSRIPVLLPRTPMLALDSSQPGWVDREFGADVLALPVPSGDKLRFACPACGAR